MQTSGFILSHARLLNGQKSSGNMPVYRHSPAYFWRRIRYAVLVVVVTTVSKRGEAWSFSRRGTIASTSPTLTA